VRYQPPVERTSDEVVIRNDAGVREGDEISMFYDPMISKLCAWGVDRAAAAASMAQALEDFYIDGVGHNVPFLSAVVDEPRFLSGRLSTGYIAETYPEGFKGLTPTPFQADLMTAAAAYMHYVSATRSASVVTRRDYVAVLGGDGSRRLKIDPTTGGMVVSLPDESRTLELSQVDWRPGQALFRGVLNGRPFTAEATPAPEGFDIRHRAARRRVLILTPMSAELHERLPHRPPADTSKQILSPMPGLIVGLWVAVGQEVKAGEQVCVIEAMKMQNILKAERDGRVKDVCAGIGDSVAADQILVEFE